MKNFDKTRKQLLKEIDQLRVKITELEKYKTGREQAEKELKESEEYYRLLYERAPLGYYSLDENGNLLEVNQAWLETLGYSRNEVTGKWFGDFLTPEFRNRFREDFLNFISTGMIDDVEFDMFHKKGYVISVEVIGRISRDNAGNFQKSHCVLKDVTESRQAEIKLYKQKKLFDKIIHTSNAIIVGLDKNHKVRLFNEGAEKTTGYKKNEVMDKDWLKIFFKPEINKEMAKIWKDSWGIQYHSSINHIRIKNGEERIISWQTTGIYNGEDKKKHLQISVGDDITEHRQKVKTLKENEQKLRNIFENSTNLFYSHTTDHMLTYLSPQVKDILGYTQEEAMTKWTKFASDNPINEEGFKKTVKAIETGKLQPPYELELVHKSGKKVRVEVREAPIVENGKTVSIVGALTDITDRKLTEEALRKTEEKFRNLVQNMAEGIGIVDLKERFVYANPAAERIFGVGQGELVGSALSEFVDDETAAFLKNQTKLRQRDETSRYDFTFTRNDKTKQYLSVTASPQIDDNGKIMNTLGIFYDITRRKQAEKELKHRFELIQLTSEISRKFLNLSTDQIDKEIYNALKKVAKLAGADRSSLFLFSDDLATVTNTHEWCTNPESSQIKQLQGIPFDMFGFHTKALLKHKVVVISSIDDYPPEAKKERKWVEKYGFRSMLFAPIFSKGKLYGTFGFYGEANKNVVWPEFFIELLKVIGDMFVNILKRKREEEKLRDAKASLKNTFDISPGLICVADANTGYFTECNPAVTRILGISVEKFMSRPFLEFVHPDDRQKTVDEITKQLKGSPVANFENRYRCEDGSFKWMAWQATAADKNGKLHAVATDITGKKQAEEELKKSSEQLHALSTHLQSIREDERATIAREIHDELGQGLTALKMDLSLMGREIEEEPDNLNTNDLLNEIKSMSGFIDKTIQKVRKIITELRPEVLDSLGLIAALEWLCEEFQIHSGIICNFHTTYKEINSDNKQSIAIYRIVQEALTNIARHAKAASANVKIKKDKNNTIVEISDNGIGFSKAANKSKKTFGLLGMKERAIVFGGEVKIISVKNKGTTVKLKIPLKNTARSKHD